MPDKSVRAVNRLVPRLSRGAKAEVCKIAMNILDDVDRGIIRSTNLGDYNSIRNLSNEAIFIKALTADCNRFR
ncbi:hypothetical protein NTE_02533 [Candidatus Nitrososphaera evergladensis SR1]|uniref:Uncharacterized protein n=1 Tax=Candidatus Nitrososphaera evergladensis SR1 TaxID=1459636 RepID=A0A075MTR9_9ARCH|nr:hypothetical protein [Candidatus Nitrososphaera evergladensis]AIF84580.1 hypothetical protein NTE_02533 [Candidatus Nitrososphaera evergladensis SR1]